MHKNLGNRGHAAAGCGGVIYFTEGHLVEMHGKIGEPGHRS